ncbi:hypothetical protein IV203_029410 [Nitzschia inconspicua]|uniref:Uncharacterized protein n=1 Tax=Nitzschia inconspicua TaxID=303405 RepID=A0A9K3LQJ2_9STRA|nr:hypothetical protein IV203_029410 [Nitzschia inconspicua]
MEPFRKSSAAAARKPKGSFPSIYDEGVKVKTGKGTNKYSRKRVANTVLGKFIKGTVRIAKSKMASLGKLQNLQISFDQSLSRDSTIREEEIFLMDYVDGTFEV